MKPYVFFVLFLVSFLSIFFEIKNVIRLFFKQTKLYLTTLFFIRLCQLDLSCLFKAKHEKYFENLWKMIFLQISKKKKQNYKIINANSILHCTKDISAKFSSIKSFKNFKTKKKNSKKIYL